MNQKCLQEKQLVWGSEEYNTQLLYFTSSSLSADDKRIYMICDSQGSPNVIVKDLETGEIRQLSQNTEGCLKSYVYFNGNPEKGLGKASVCLDAERDIVYYIQGNDICKVGMDGQIQILNQIPSGQMTAFSHVSRDGNLLCIPTTDGRCLDYDPGTEGYGLDQRPIYDIDGRVQEEHLNSYLHVYDTHTGEELKRVTVPDCWITHVQFHPKDPDKIMYNHEWASFDCGIRRMWLYDGKNHIRLRTPSGERRADDWVCHEMWSDDGNYVIYHGALAGGPAFVGRLDIRSMEYSEIPLPSEYNAYGHFTMDHEGNLVCDGYFKFPDEIKKVRENSTDNGPDPHKKDGEYISVQKVDWEKKEITWIPLCRHESDWLGQDAHPHAIYNHKGDRVYFSSRNTAKVKVYCADVKNS
ncbi:hypothetical protein [Acetatifactor muris]|uniref:hypothetical protein n=1 Tax=Acetatifactor muris TaxID=879566 RepID=UPI0023F16FF9|nr:hypothetical protein [Acetatifactor muris]